MRYLRELMVLGLLIWILFTLDDIRALLQDQTDLMWEEYEEVDCEAVEPDGETCLFSV